MRIGVLASGTGTNLQALLDRVHDHDGNAVVGVASDKPRAGALARAEAAGVPTAVFAGAEFADRAARDAAMADWLALKLASPTSTRTGSTMCKILRMMQRKLLLLRRWSYATSGNGSY